MYKILYYIFYSAVIFGAYDAPTVLIQTYDIILFM